MSRYFLTAHTSYVLPHGKLLVFMVLQWADYKCKIIFLADGLSIFKQYKSNIQGKI